jgi:hypothetical protein
MVFIQPGIHSLPQFAGVHRLVMTVKAFSSKGAGEPLDEGLFLGDWGLVKSVSKAARAYTRAASCLCAALR